MSNIKKFFKYSKLATLDDPFEARFYYLQATKQELLDDQKLYDRHFSDCLVPPKELRKTVEQHSDLSSQIFANFYLSTFDHFIKGELKNRFYGRYVDDFVIVHPSKEYLKKLVIKIRIFLKDNLKLVLHPKKIYLQHYTKGVKFLGVVIKPYRTYIAKRTKGNFYTAMLKQNNIVNDKRPTIDEKNTFLCSMNSYLGIMKNYKSYYARQRMIDNLSHWWWSYVWLNTGLTKFILY